MSPQRPLAHALFFGLIWAGLATPTAQACDGRALEKELVAASPHGAGAMYVKLANCDANRAKRQSKATFARLLPGESANEAAFSAIGIGHGVVVSAWIGGQQSDERARTIKAFGKACSNNPAVAQFFVDTHDSLGQAFWAERWHAGLRTCRTPPIQNLLSKAISRKWRDSTQFSSVIETYARNLGVAAIPALETLAADGSPEEALFVVGLFPDAAGVGSLEGTDAAAAKAAVQAIERLTPTLDVKGVEQARVTLQVLGDEAAADRLATVRYKDTLQADGSLLWGVIAVETAVCKNGKTQLGLHFSTATEPGKRWADQIKSPVEKAVRAQWDLGLSAKCKGQQTVELIMTPRPLANAEAIIAWQKEEWKDLLKRPHHKLRVYDDDTPLRLN